MNGRPVVRRSKASLDVEAAVDHYLAEAGGPTALGFIDALEAAFAAIAEHPASGSPRWAQELDLPGLRSRVVAGYPYVVFYVEREHSIDVWRVLHAHRDLTGLVEDPDAD